MHIQKQTEVSAELVGNTPELCALLRKHNLPITQQVMLFVEFDGNITRGDVRAEKVFFVHTDGAKTVIYDRTNHQEAPHDVCAALIRMNRAAAHQREQRRKKAQRVPAPVT